MGEILEPIGKKAEEKEAPKQETLAEVLAKPLGEDEARMMLADLDVQLAQLRALRIQRTAEMNQLEYQIAAAEFDRAVIFRRVLNKEPEATKDAK